MDEPVLLTGAGGHVGQVILRGLSEEYDWRLMYHSQPAEEPDHPYWTGEVQDYEDVAPAAEGVGEAAVEPFEAGGRLVRKWATVRVDPSRLSPVERALRQSYEAAVV